MNPLDLARMEAIDRANDERHLSPRRLRPDELHHERVAELEELLEQAIDLVEVGVALAEGLEQVAAGLGLRMQAPGELRLRFDALLRGAEPCGSLGELTELTE